MRVFCGMIVRLFGNGRLRLLYAGAGGLPKTWIRADIRSHDGFYIGVGARKMTYNIGNIMGQVVSREKHQRCRNDGFIPFPSKTIKGDINGRRAKFKICQFYL